MAALLNFWNSPNKQPNKPPVNGTGSELRGTKRKAKAKLDPYEDMDDDDDDVIPARKTPTSQRTARSRLSSATPSSSTRHRISLSERPSRSSLKSHQGDASDTAATSQPNTVINSSRAKASDGARMQPNSQPNSLVPEAPMGGLELPSNGATDASVSLTPARQPAPADTPSRNKRRAKQTEIVSNQPARDNKEEKENDIREEQEIAKLMKHRMASDRSNSVELLVQWVNEDEDEATWESEAEIQQGAGEILYEYWKAQGGRINALFHKPKNPPPEVYHVFKILRHEKKNRGGFQFEVQWVGHPATRGETSMETETKLKNVAPELLHEYWESIGGRASHLAPRGRVKKTRSE